MTKMARRYLQSIACLICGLVLIGGVLSAQSSEAATYYVATNGSDTNTCTQAQNVATAKRTFSGAVGCLSSGDTLTFKAGSYAGPGLGANNIPSGTSWANATTIRAAAGEVVTFTAPNSTSHVIWIDSTGTRQYIIFTGGQGTNLKLTAAGTVDHNCGRLTGAGVGFIRIEHFECSIGPAHGFLIGGKGGWEFKHCNIHHLGSNPRLDHAFYIPDNVTRADDPPPSLIDDCDLHDMAFGAGIQFFDNSPRNWTVQNNRIWNTQINGIIDVSSWRTRYYNNIIWSTQGGIETTDLDNHIINNTIFNVGHGPGNSKPCIEILPGGLQLGGRVENNICYGNNYRGIYISDLTNGPGVVNHMVIRNNLSSNNVAANFENGSTGDDFTITGNLFGNQYNPSFVNGSTDPNTNVLRLQPGSAAIDAGITVAELTIDRVGVSRPQRASYDIGAYEFVSGLLVPPLSPSGLSVRHGN